MVNSIHPVTTAAHAYPANTLPAKHPAHAKPEQPQDAVVLSKQAAGSVDADHDGDSR